MKDFSNETKEMRRNAVLKVVLKRYSFIIWLPLLLYILNYIGKYVCLFIDGRYTGVLIIDIFVNIIAGLEFLFVLFLVIILGILVPYTICHSVISYIKKKTLFKDLKKIFLTIFKLPIKLLRRIKDEKRLFKNAVDRQITKDINQNIANDN